MKTETAAPTYRYIDLPMEESIQHGYTIPASTPDMTPVSNSGIHRIATTPADLQKTLEDLAVVHHNRMQKAGLHKSRA